MSVDYFSCRLDPITGKTLRLYLYKNVENAETVRKHIVSGEWRCAAVKPALVLAPLQVAVAANKAAVSAAHGTLVTRTLYTELLFNLSLSKNITQSLARFGVEQDRELLVCFLTDDEENDDSSEILAQIKGEACDIAELTKFVNMDEVRTVYKLKNVQVKDDDELLNLIISRIVTKNFVSH